MQVVQQLLDLQYQRMKSLEEDFVSQLRALAAEFEGERNDVASALARHKKDSSEVVHAMQLGFHELESDVRQVRASAALSYT